MTLGFGVDITTTSVVGYGTAIVLMVAFAIAVVRSAAQRAAQGDSAPSPD